MPAARGQAPDAGEAALGGSGLPDAASWWGEVGRAGWQPGAWYGLAPPASLAGLVLGGWKLEEPGRAPSALPWPGVCQSRSPLAWYDSLEVRGSGEGAGAGFDGALASLLGHPAQAQRRARSTFSFANGAGGLDENALTIARGDSLRQLGVDVASGEAGAVGGAATTNRHLWGARLGVTRGSHRVEGGFAQRGAATQLASAEGPSASAADWLAAWRWSRGGTAWSARVVGGADDRESSGGTLAYSSRQARETRVAAAFGQARGAGEVGAQLEWTGASVRRLGEGAFERESGSAWGSLHAGLPAAGGRLDLSLGAGRHGGVDRFAVAPGARYAARARGVDVSLGVERLLTPVWADLAAGTEPFLQHAWIGSLGLAAAQPGAWRPRGSVRAGRVYSRALLERLPFEELWLRRGLRLERGNYDFALVEGGMEWAGRHAVAGLEGFGLAHRSVPGVPGVLRAPRSDPDAGFRTWLGGRALVLGGDLGIALRAEAAGVGAREARVEPLRRVPGFVTFGLTGEFTLLHDAVIVVRARNLEDRERPELWTDPATGLPALSERRNVTVSFTWRLFD